jgi:ACS family tartrate transporter-like MFS transporter
LNPVVWALGLLAFFSISFGQYTLSLWLPQIVRGFAGLSNLQVGFVSAIPSLVAVVGMLFVASHSDRTGERCMHIAAASSVAVIGFVGSRWRPLRSCRFCFCPSAWQEC